MNKTYKLVRVINEPVKVENEPTYYKRTQQTVYTGKTWEEAKELRNKDRSLSIVAERKTA